MATITERVLSAQQAETGIDEVVEAISQMVYRYPVGRHGFTEEDSAEFLLRFYPRIRRLVRRYRPEGSSFDAYLNATLRWQLRSLALQRGSSRIRLAAACERETAREILGHDGMVAEPGHDQPLAKRECRCGPEKRRPPRKMPAHRPSVLPLRPEGPMPDRLSPGQAQRLLCMALKAGDRLDPELRERISRVTGCQSDWLEDRWLELREITRRLHARKHQVRVRRDQAWFRLRCVEARIAGAHPTEREVLREQRTRWATRYERARGDLRKMGQGPTHLQIAEVLGIAKGTVDSSVFKAREELQCAEYRERLARLFDAT
ncbi:MAG TPA: hypothetical protein VKA06_11430 [Spirochaetia bacterium]|nr:hypothetical protein [Spirochaetia bacterium]